MVNDDANIGAFEEGCPNLHKFLALDGFRGDFVCPGDGCCVIREKLKVGDGWEAMREVGVQQWMGQGFF